MVKETELYERVGVQPDATPAEIRRAYRKTALRLHPDRGGDTEEFQQLQAAYATLYDAEKRRVYDQFGQEGLDEGAFATESTGPSITKEDIEAFCRSYRFSEMEKEDVEAFFKRMNGKVDKVLQFIPYADVRDLARFMTIFDAVEDSDREGDTAGNYKKARKKLAKRAKKSTPREKEDFTLEEQDVDEPEDAEDISDGGIDEDVRRSKRTKKKPKRILASDLARKPKKSKKSHDMADLYEQIEQRRNQRKEQFASWIDDMEKRAEADLEEEELKNARKNRKKRNKEDKDEKPATRSERLSKRSRKSVE